MAELSPKLLHQGGKSRGRRGALPAADQSHDEGRRAPGHAGHDRAARGGRDGSSGENRNPEPPAHRFAQRRCAAAFEREIRLDPRALESGLDRSPISASLLGQEKRLAFEIANLERAASGESMAARKQERHLLLEEGLEFEAELRRRSGADTEVELSVRHGSAHSLSPAHLQTHPQVGPASAQPSEKRRHILARGRLDRPDSQQPAPAVAQLGHAAMQGVDGVENGKGARSENLARFRSEPAATAPVKERKTKLSLELLDVKRHGWLSQPESPGRASEAALADHGLKGEEMPEVHMSKISVFLIIYS